MNAEAISLVTEDGVRLQLQHYRASLNNSAAILITPAMGAHAHAYRHIAAAFAERGHAVMVLDPRGSGESDGRPSRDVDFGVYEFLKYDWSAAVNELERQYPQQKLVLLGHSFGGQLNCAYAGMNPGRIYAVINLCSSWLHFRSFGPAYQQVATAMFYGLMRLSAEVLGYAPGDKLGWGARFARTHIRDWSRWGLTGRYRYHNGGDLADALGALTAPVFAVSFTDDARLGPAAACDDFCRRLYRARITRRDFDPDEVGKSSVGHFGALKDAPIFWNIVDGWISEISS